MTPHDPLGWLDDALAGLQRDGLRRHRRVGSGLPGEDAIDFGSNDYLGLAGDPRLAEAARQAAERHGWGSGASPVVSGRTELHAELEEQIAAFEGTEAAIFLPSGFAANTGVIPALVDESDALFTDSKNHASLIDGCRLSRAERHVYAHNSVEALERLLERAAGCRRRLIVTDGLFSMDGDFAPLVEIGELAERYGAMLLVDEAHATGVWGPGGRGSVEHFAALTGADRLESQVTVRVGTLSKALGSAGGFVTGSQKLIDWLHNRTRSYVFSTAPPAALAAAAIAAIQIVQTEPERRRRVVRLGERLRQSLTEAGWRTGGSASQIVPIVVGDPKRAVALSERLAAQGLFVPAIRPPSVPVGESLLRVSLSAGHSDDDLQRLVAALGRP